MKKKLIALGSVLGLCLAFMSDAMASGVTAPTIDVTSYVNSLFTGWGSAVGSLLPDVGIATVAAATLTLLYMWIGKKRLPGLGGRHK